MTRLPWRNRLRTKLFALASESLLGLPTFLVSALRAPSVAAAGIGNPPLIVMVVYSDLRIDPRVRREARALADAGFRVKIIYPDTMSTTSNQVVLDYGPGIEFRPLPSAAASYLTRFPYLFGRELLDAICQERPSAIHAHDLSTALVGLAAAGRLGVPCVCDFHEWYSENVSWDAGSERYVAHSRSVRLAYRWAERLAMWRAAAVITVSDSIAQGLRRLVPSKAGKVRVVRNIPLMRDPPTRQYDSIRDELGLPSDKLVVLWQGGTGPTRLLEPVIEALGHYAGFVLVIRGPSLDRFGDGYRSLAAQINASDRLYLCPAVPSQDVVASARGADCGLWTLPNLCKNFFYALPNKVFEYLYAGLPVLAADYPEVRKIVADLGVGLMFDPYDPRSIAAAIKRLHEDPTLSETMKARIPAVIADIDADIEWKKLTEIYRVLLPRHRAFGDAQG